MATTELLHHKTDTTTLPILYEKSATLPIVSLQLIFTHAGSIADSEPLGVSNLLAEILHEGTKAEGTIAFARALENRAIEIDINAGRETFVINLNALKEDLDFALDALVRLLKDPNFTDASLQKVKTKVLGEIEQKVTDFDYQAAKALRTILFKGSILEHPAIGTQKSIEAITLKDLEQTYRTRLGSDNLILLVGGMLDKGDVAKIADAILAPFSAVKRPPLPYITPTTKAQYVHQYEKSDQAYIYFGAPYDLKNDDSDAYKAKVAAFILGSSGFGSRLMEEIRVKRGLAYSAYCRTSLTNSHSYFSGYLQTKVESEKEAVDVVRQEIEHFVKEGVTQKELDAAKRFLLGSEPLRTETLSARLYRAFQEHYSGKGIGYSLQELKKIEALSLKELNAFIASHSEITQLSFAVLTAKP